MTAYTIHPAAELFPLIDGEELEGLAADIRANGLREPITLDREGRVLDGRNRLRACELAGVEPTFRVYDGDDPVGFVVSENLQRRHLTASQRAVIALDVERAYAEEARERQELGRRRGAEVTNAKLGRSPEIVPESVPERLEPDDRREAREEAGKLAGVSGRYIQDAKRLAREAPELLPEVLAGRVTLPEALRSGGLSTAQLIMQSGTVEWYTPRRFVDAARAVMGGIDLDPASCAAANEVVGAATFYTAEDDGLSRPWFGRVWLNPPYGGLAADFVTRLIVEYEARRVKAGIVLVNAHSTDTAWFQKLLGYTVCFTRGRIDFWGPAREGASTPTHGSAFAYLGGDPERFTEEFRQFGKVVRGA